WKIEVLGGFGGAIFLLGVAAMMLFASLERLVWPQPIQYREAIVVAALGLVVNIVCALILGRAHNQDHGHSHGHDHGAGDGHNRHQDLNLKSAYLHVVADATTSVLAIVALVGGWFYGWSWLDPLMGIVGAILIAWWAKGLLTESAKVLLDREMDHPVVDGIREVVEGRPGEADSRITDLHVWRVGRHAYSCAMTIVTTDAALTADSVRERLSIHGEIVHSTIEIHHLQDHIAADRAGAPG
ncbi:MAG: cation diffusion facilitator family transporter, partial [Burkholderiales bacterium]